MKNIPSNYKTQDLIYLNFKIQNVTFEYNSCDGREVTTTFLTTSELYVFFLDAQSRGTHRKSKNRMLQQALLPTMGQNFPTKRISAHRKCTPALQDTLANGTGLLLSLLHDCLLNRKHMRR